MIGPIDHQSMGVAESQHDATLLVSTFLDKEGNPSMRILCALLLATAVSVSACTGTENPGGTEKKIVLEVGGSGKTADVTYGIGANQSQENGATVPWKKETSSADAILITVLTAQAKDGSEITCKITVDGKVVAENKSSGEFAIVTCSK